MNNTNKTPTLGEALSWDDAAGLVSACALGARDFDFSESERFSTRDLWLHLTGFEPGSALASVAIDEVWQNMDLFIMLNSPAREFVNWFRRDDWELYNLTEETGNDEWACRVLERARMMCNTLGTLSLQLPLKAPKP